MALGVLSLLGMLGLALDLGRVYITKNETQSFTDTAAIAAVLKLNGVSVVPAQNAIANNTKNQWNMATTIFTASGGASTIATEFAKPLAANANKPDESTWSDAPATAAGYTFVRVMASATLPLYILPVVGSPKAQLVRASSVAGQVPVTTFKSGLLPYSPIQHTGAAATACPPFGFCAGQWYTIRSRSGGAIQANDLCPGDQAAEDLSTFLVTVNRQPGDLRGFYQDPSASMVSAEIIDGKMVYPVSYPGAIAMYGGEMQTAAGALNRRIDGDTDNKSTSYEQYQANMVNGDIVGNGFRLVGVPANDGAAGATRNVTGFAGFFLSANSVSAYYTGGGSQPFCAEYYGTWSKGQSSQGAGNPGTAYVSVLVQ